MRHVLVSLCPWDTKPLYLGPHSHEAFLWLGSSRNLFLDHFSNFCQESNIESDGVCCCFWSWFMIFIKVKTQNWILDSSQSIYPLSCYRDFSQGSSQRTTCQHPKQKPTNISLSGFRSLTLKKGIPSLTQRRGSILNQFAENSQLAKFSYSFGILTLIDWN